MAAGVQSATRRGRSARGPSESLRRRSLLDGTLAAESGRWNQGGRSDDHGREEGTHERSRSVTRGSTTRVLLERILEEKHADDMHDLLVSHEGRPTLPPRDRR